MQMAALSKKVTILQTSHISNNKHPVRVHIETLRACYVLLSGPEPKPDLKGDTRTYRVWLDPNQYQKDMTGTIDGKEV